MCTRVTNAMKLFVRVYMRVATVCVLNSELPVVAYGVFCTCGVVVFVWNNAAFALLVLLFLLLLLLLWLLLLLLL